MKNLYPIFLYSLLTLILLTLILVNTARSQSIGPQSEVLLILDRNSLYENNADSVRVFIQRLVQKQGSSLRVFEQGKDSPKNFAFANFRLIIALGEKSLHRLSPAVQEKLKTYILGIEGKAPHGFLGIFFQDDRIEISDPWDWFTSVKEELEESRTARKEFPLEFSASLEDASHMAKPMSYQHIFPSLMPKSNLSGSRFFLSYMASRRQAFSHTTVGKLRNGLLQKHLEAAFSWLLGQGAGLLEKANILSLKLRAQGNKVLFNWQDFSYSVESEFLLQKSKDGIHWDIIHTRPATIRDSEKVAYTYLDSNIEAGDYIFRILKRQKGRLDTYSTPVLLSVSLARPIIELFPNPTKDILFVNISSENIQETNISIQGSFLTNPLWETKLSGEYLSQRLPIIVSSLKPGLYHVCVKTSDSRVWKTFVKYE